MVVIESQKLWSANGSGKTFYGNLRWDSLYNLEISNFDKEPYVHWGQLRNVDIIEKNYGTGKYT